MTPTAPAATPGVLARLLVRVLRIAIGAVFVYAGAVKIFDPVGFAVDIDNYRMMPAEAINLMAITLPWIEVVVGLLLVVGVWVKSSAWIVSLLLIMFLIAISQALARGLNIDCGCFGTLDARKIGLWALIQDLVMLAASGWLAWKARD